MPIRPENRSRYPGGSPKSKEWGAIRAAILARAGNRCEGSPAYPHCRAENGRLHPVSGKKVVLTIAHLDHMPETTDPALLRAWCQRCHLAYDQEHHRRNAERTRRRRGGQLELPDL